MDDWADFFSSPDGYLSLGSLGGSDYMSGPTGSADWLGGLPLNEFSDYLDNSNWWDSFTSSGNPDSIMSGSGSLDDAASSGGIADWFKNLNLGSLGGGFTSGGLLAAGLGALAGGIGGDKQAGTTTAKQAPWEPQQPYLLDLWGKASSQLNSADPLTGKAKLNYGSLLAGPTANPYAGLDNPYLRKAIDNAQSDFMRGFMPLQNQANIASGSFGNSGVADIYSKQAADQLGRIDTNMRMQDYLGQQQLAENAVNRTASATQGTADFNFSPLKNYGSLVSGTNFGSTMTTPYFNNPTGNAIGGALAGASIYNNLFNNKQG